MSPQVESTYVNSSFSIKEYAGLLRIGAAFSWLTVAAILLSIISFFIWPPFPEDLIDVIARSHFAGIMSLDALYLVAVLFTLPLILCLYVILQNQNKALALLALISGIISVVLIVLARPIVEMVSLGDKYAHSIDKSEKAAYLAAFKSLQELFNGTSYYLHIFFGNISFIISSVLMLKSEVFNKASAVLGIVTNSIAFGIFVPTIGPFFGFVFLVGFIPWLIIVSIRLLKCSTS
jgi:hypothetical protein